MKYVRMISCILSCVCVLMSVVLGVLYGLMGFLVPALCAVIFAVIMVIAKNRSEPTPPPKRDFMYSDEENEAIRKQNEQDPHGN